MSSKVYFKAIDLSGQGLSSCPCLPKHNILPVYFNNFCTSYIVSYIEIKLLANGINTCKKCC